VFPASESRPGCRSTAERDGRRTQVRPHADRSPGCCFSCCHAERGRSGGNRCAGRGGFRGGRAARGARDRRVPARAQQPRRSSRVLPAQEASRGRWQAGRAGARARGLAVSPGPRRRDQKPLALNDALFRVEEQGAGTPAILLPFATQAQAVAPRRRSVCGRMGSSSSRCRFRVNRAGASCSVRACAIPPPRNGRADSPALGGLPYGQRRHGHRRSGHQGGRRSAGWRPRLGRRRRHLLPDGGHSGVAAGPGGRPSGDRRAVHPGAAYRFTPLPPRTRSPARRRICRATCR
jgi:hypothetical protein